MLGLDTSDTVVLVIGAATVLAQFYAAHKGAGVAERQAEAAEAQTELAGKQVAAAESQLRASEAALRGELQSVLVLTRGPLSTNEAVVRVYNGGRYAAIDLTIDSDVGSGRTTIVAPMQERAVHVSLGTVEKREAFAQAATIRARWSDGMGERSETLHLLPP
jgi:hypothetical protein